MFTGIIESLATVLSVQDEGTNRHFTLRVSLDEPIKVDQSIAHNGVCLTVTEIFLNEPEGWKEYSVTAVEETLLKTDLGGWKAGRLVNIERCLKIGARMDGHFVQGHVDTTGTVKKIEDRGGSWILEFAFPPEFSNLIVNKGSICVNGTSLTVVESGKGWFSITLIPFTWEHTSFHTLQVGDTVNLEFDILGKYFLKAQGLAHG